MIALCFVLAGIIAALVPLCAWLTYRVVKDSENDGDIRVAQVATEAELERAQFRISELETSLAASRRRELILDRAVAESLNDDPNRDLRLDDITTRMRRIDEEFARADRQDGTGPVTSPGMSPDPAPDAPESPAVSGFRTVP